MGSGTERPILWIIGSTSFLNSQRAWLLLRFFNPQWQKRFERSESERPNISKALMYQKLRLCCTRSRDSSFFAASSAVWFAEADMPNFLFENLRQNTLER